MRSKESTSSSDMAPQQTAKEIVFKNANDSMSWRYWHSGSTSGAPWGLQRQILTSSRGLHQFRT